MESLKRRWGVMRRYSSSHVIKSILDYAGQVSRRDSAGGRPEGLPALIDADEVPGRIAQDGEGVTGAERHARGHGLAPELAGLLERAIDVLHHDVGEDSRVPRGTSTEDPRPADRTARVVEGARPIAADPELPAEELHVERRGDLDVGRRDL